MSQQDEAAPDSNAGWSREIVTMADATVVPPDTAKFRQRAGLFDSQGRYRQEGATWRYDRPMTLRPRRLPRKVERLTGRWLWAGTLFNHFGHFLVESASRLWGLHRLDPPVDGLCYIPKRPRQSTELAKFQNDFLLSFGISVPVRVLAKPTKIDELVVPGQGFGLGRINAGTPEMRDAVRSQFGTAIDPDGHERLYVSRSALGPSGGIIGEVELESLLASEGYEIFHPQDHDIATQVSRYKAARQVIIADGSAGHLFAYVGRADQNVAYIPRRSFWTEGPIEQITHFCGRPPLVPDTVLREWRPKDGKQFRGLTFVKHDFSRLHAALRGAGFVDTAATWPDLSDADAEARIRRLMPDMEFVNADAPAA